MADETRKGSAFDLVAGMWSRRKWLALLVFAVPFTAAATLVTFLPNIFKSSATILVERQQVPEEFVKPTVTSGLEIRLHTITQEILSRSRLEQLITRFGLYRNLKDQVSGEALIEQMRSDIQLELKGGSSQQQQRGPKSVQTIAFTVSYRGRDPQTVAAVANTLASFYIEENLKTRERQATGTAEFLRVQLQGVKQRLDVQERRVSEFKKAHLGELPQQLQANLSTLERLNSQLRLNSENQVRTAERRELLARQLADLKKQLAERVAQGDSPGAITGPSAAAAQLARMKGELAQLQTRFSDKYPDVIRLKAEITLLERQLAEAPPPAPTPQPKEPPAPVDPQLGQLQRSLSEAEGQLRALQVEERDLRVTLVTYQRRLENTPRREQEFQELSRDYETTKELYTSLLKRYEEAQLAESMEQRQKGEQFRILEPALPSSETAAPKRGQLILVGLALALGLAVGSVVLREQLDTSFHTVDDLRGFTTVPVLASIPRIVTESDAHRRRWRFRLAAVSAIAGLTLVAGAAYLVARGNEQLVWMVTRGGSTPQR